VFVQPERLAAWTRSPPVIEAKVGGNMVLFQGNVKGEFITLEEGKKIEQTWRLPQWPEGTRPPCSGGMVVDGQDIIAI
jgi:activator of HSP90 ATPase